MVQTGPAALDESRDRTLILFRRAGTAMLDLCVMVRIEILKELQLAITNRDKRNPQAADHLGCAVLVHHAVFIGRETFDNGTNLKIGLLAFDRESHPLRENLDGSAIIGRSDAKMIDTLDRTAGGAWNVQRRTQPNPHAQCRRRIQHCLRFTINAALRCIQIHGYPRRLRPISRVLTRKRNMVQPGIGRAGKKGIVRVEQQKCRAPRGKSRYSPSAIHRDLHYRHTKAVAEYGRDRVRIANY